MAKRTSKKINRKSSIIRISLEITALTCAALTFIIHLLRLNINKFIFYSLPFIFIIDVVALYIHSRFEANKDGLTELPNSDRFTKFAIFKYIEKKLPAYTSIFLNLKNFKYVNRLNGSFGADEALQQYAKYLKKFIIKGEMVARVGGDNFILLLHKHRVNDFLKYIHDPELYIRVNGEKKPVHIKARCGIHALTNYDTVSSVFLKTNIALTQAKSNSSEDYVWFKQEMTDRLEKEHIITSNFEDAIKNEQFKIYMQPIVDIRTNKIVSTEALVRWEHDGKIILPEEFISVLEHTGLISQLDFFVLDRACHNIKDWIDAGNFPIRTSVNFSNSDLRIQDFDKQILSIINKYELDKSLISISLTDYGDACDYELLKSFLQKMSDARIDVVLDDFGICFSKPDLLQEHNVKFLKLSKNFVQGIESNNGSNSEANLVKNIVNICHDLEINLVCVGVENISQKKLLEEMRCYLLQGKLFDEPLNREEFENRLKSPVYTLKEE